MTYIYSGFISSWLSLSSIHYTRYVIDFIALSDTMTHYHVRFPSCTRITFILSHVYEESRGFPGSSRCMRSFGHGIYRLCLLSVLTRSINRSPNAVPWYWGRDSFVNRPETRAAIVTVKSVIDVIEQDPFAGVVLLKPSMLVSRSDTFHRRDTIAIARAF